MTGMKFDGDKPRMDLLLEGCPMALLAVAEVLTFGAKKYADHSWFHVPNADKRYWSARSRHELQRATGDDYDEESGLLHLAHEACNSLFILEIKLRELNDECL